MANTILRSLLAGTNLQNLLACTKSGACVCTPWKSNSYSNCTTFVVISFAIILGCSGPYLLLILDFCGAIIAMCNWRRRSFMEYLETCLINYKKRLKYAKLFFTTLSLEETSAPALIIEVFQNSSSFYSWKSQQHSSISWTFFWMLQIFNQSLKSLQETSSCIWSTCTFSLPEIFACNLVDLHFHSITYLKNLKNLSTISIQETFCNWRTHHCHYHAYKYSRFLVYCQYQYKDPIDIETWNWMMTKLFYLL